MRVWEQRFVMSATKMSFMFPLYKSVYSAYVSFTVITVCFHFASSCCMSIMNYTIIKRSPSMLKNLKLVERKSKAEVSVWRRVQEIIEEEFEGTLMQSSFLPCAHSVQFKWVTVCIFYYQYRQRMNVHSRATLGDQLSACSVHCPSNQWATRNSHVLPNTCINSGL